MMNDPRQDGASVALGEESGGFPIPVHDDEYPAAEAPATVAEANSSAVTTGFTRSSTDRLSPSLQAILTAHLREVGLTARGFAEHHGVSYPTVLAAVKKGSLPRKPEHREALREALDITPDDWAGILAVSGRDHIDLGGSAPTLQQLVLKAILGRGQTEQTFAQESGVPYPTILGVTRKGAIPRTETLVTMAAALSLALADVTAAVERSKAIRREGSPPVPDPATQSLAQMVANTARRNGQSLAAFARVHSLPYLAVMKLVGSGEPPTETDILERFAQALGMDTSEFGSLVDRSRDCPEPASMVNEDGDQVTPLQAALKSVIEQKALTMKAFAELSELSVLTATRLVKHGALPSRTTTHAKLRSLLDLDEQTYGDLVSRSKGAPQTDAIGDEDFQHQETEEIMPDGENGEALARRSLDPELVRLICGLDPRKRDALKVFLKTLA